VKASPNLPVLGSWDSRTGEAFIISRLRASSARLASILLGWRGWGAGVRRFCCLCWYSENSNTKAIVQYVLYTVLIAACYMHHLSPPTARREGNCPPIAHSIFVA
jgi:hypothetical protein